MFFFSQGNVLQHNVSAGVIVSETSLVLQRVSRHATGRYTCHAINTEGEGSSGAFQLNVLRKWLVSPVLCLRHAVSGRILPMSADS